MVLMPLNAGTLVEIAVVERRERGLEHLVGARDVDDDAVLVERLGQKCDADDEGRTMHFLGRAEHLAAKRMGDHDLVGYFDCVHGKPLGQRAVSAAG